MNFEVLKRSNLKRNIIIGVVVVAIITAVVITFSRASYKSVAKVDLVDGVINYSLADFNVIAMYQQKEDSDEYEPVDEVPSSGYTLSTESNCTVNGEQVDYITITYADGEVNFTGVTKKGTKCYLYFDIGEAESAKKYILANYSTVETRENFDTTVEGETTGVIYESYDETQYDDYGKVYYFAGNPTDNWVYFAGYYWRIIRINGDGSIRMIYAGTDPNVTTGTGTQISLDGSTTFRFNDVSTYSYHVGYMYTASSVASEGQHGNGTSSTIKETIDSWYSRNLLGYSNYLADSGFCGDREMAEGSTWVDRPAISYTYFAAWDRRSGTPTLKCSNIEDLYTVSNEEGNQALSNPIGLITLDEVRYAGAYYTTTNNDYYLYTGEYYWTMSPALIFEWEAVVSNVSSTGALYGNKYVYETIGVRPVINLKAEVTLSGEGTAESPFEVELTS